MRLEKMFTRSVLQSHRKKSKREGEIFFSFFLQQQDDTPPQPYLMLHCTLARTASSTQVRGKILNRASKSTAIGPFCSHVEVVDLVSLLSERRVSAAADF